MNLEEATNIAQQYVVYRDQEDDLSVDIPRYNILYDNLIKLFVYFERYKIVFYLQKKLSSKRYERLAVNRVLTPHIYESKLFWCFYYRSNLPIIYSNYQPFYPDSDVSGGTFIICKKTKKVFGAFLGLLHANMSFDEPSVEALEQDYLLYLNENSATIKHKREWKAGILF